MLVVEPTSGLCSRMYVLSDAYALAKKYKQELVILWTRTTDCDISYHDIFAEEQFADVDRKIIEFTKFKVRIRDIDKISFYAICLLVKETVCRIKYWIQYHVVKKYYKSRCSVHKNAYLDGNVVLDESQLLTASCYVEAYNRIIDGSDLEVIKIKRKFHKEAERILEPFGGNCVGVHVRRTDHQPAKENSSTEHFILKMREILEKNPTASFFLATDDWEEEKRLKREFGNKIVTQKEKVLNRHSQEGMRSSIVDFLCLSKTCYIIGSYESMFSKFSAQYGGIDLKII